jgi:hypothetical protein
MYSCEVLKKYLKLNLGIDTYIYDSSNVCDAAVNLL